MSVIELKRIVDESTEEERLFLQAYLAAKQQPALAELFSGFDSQAQAMNDGHRRAIAELKTEHERHTAEGR